MLKLREYIAQKLRQLRQKSGLTASEVGKLVGKSGKTVNAWENNHGQPDAEILIKLCDIYKVDDILSEFREGLPEPLSPIRDIQKKKLIQNYDTLNSLGRAKLLDYSDDLAESIKYTEIDSKEKHA